MVPYARFREDNPVVLAEIAVEAESLVDAFDLDEEVERQGKGKLSGYQNLLIYLIYPTCPLFTDMVDNNDFVLTFFLKEGNLFPVNFTRCTEASTRKVIHLFVLKCSGCDRNSNE